MIISAILCHRRVPSVGCGEAVLDPVDHFFRESALGLAEPAPEGTIGDGRKSLWVCALRL